VTPSPSELSVLKNFREKNIHENHTQKWLWSSCMDFIAEEI